MSPGNPPLRVAFVSHRSDLSGAPRCILQILQLLDRGRFEPIAVCPGPGPLMQDIAALGVPVHTVPKFPPSVWWGMRHPVLRLLAKLICRCMYVVRLYLLLRRCRVQVAFLNTLLSSGATISARLGGARVVTSLHEYRMRFSLTSPLRRFVVLRGADRLIANSRAVEAIAAEYGADPTRISVAYPGVDGRTFAGAELADSAALREAWGVSPDDLVFGAAGALIRPKGFQDLIAAMPRVLSAFPGCQLAIAGSVAEGDDAGFSVQLKRQAAGLGIGKSVTFLGQVADMPWFYGAIDILVTPSLDESFGLVALEAMCLGKPVIATAVGGLPEIVTSGETGLLVPPGSPAELSAAMVRLAGDRPLAQQLGRAGAERVRAVFTPAAYVSRVEAVLSSVADFSGKTVLS